MNTSKIAAGMLLLGAAFVRAQQTQPDPIDFADSNGWTSMFDGTSPKGWDGQPGDFELKAELRGEGAGVNSGIQYRSFVQPPRVPGGGAPGGPCPSGQPRGAANPAAEEGRKPIHILNGHVMSVFIDDDATKFHKNGLIGIQIEGTGKVSFRNLWIKMIQ